MSSRRSRRDEATRALAQCEFQTPLVVEAGAGTGKTALLVARVAAWCVGEGWKPKDEESIEVVARRVIEGVVAITFTDAAAAEMAARIGEALAGLAVGEPPVGWIPGESIEGLEDAEIAARADALCGEIHRLQVTTIHAFCQRVLTAHPFEAGLHPRFEIDADGTVLEALADEVVLEALRELDDSPERDAWEVLAVRGVGPVEVARALSALVMAGARLTDLERDPFDDDVARVLIDEVLGDVRAFLHADDGRLAHVKGAPAAVRAVGKLTDVAELLGGVGLESPFDDLAVALDLVDKKTRDRLRKWSKLDLGKAEARCLGDDVEVLAESAGQVLSRLDGLRGLDPEAFGAARSVLLRLMTEVEERRAGRGIATFADMLVKTAELFEEHGGICRAERRGIDQLLVDEFQDTDDVQCRIVRRLALDGPEEERPGLFVVGDPKQSIYAWRSADLKAYDEFVDEVEAAGGEKHPLTNNFRSVKPILDEVERVIEPVMERKRGFQPVFEGLDATGERVSSVGFARGSWSAVEHWNCWAPDGDGVLRANGSTVADMNTLEARAIAADMRSLHDDAGVAFGDMAVLLRSTTAQGVILEAFRELDVPFEVAREREYYRQREIIEAAGLVRAILEPADALALLTVLRSDAVGVPDAALAPLWDAGLPAAGAAIDGSDGAAIDRVRRLVADTAEKVEDKLGVDQVPFWPQVLTGALERLAELRRSMREDPPDVFVEGLRTLWLAEISAAARYLGRFRQARLDGFLSDLEKTLTGGRGSASEVARFLRQAVGEGREAPSVPEPDLEADAVHVMTVYGAKGLDFDHVYLAQIHRGTPGPIGQVPALIHRRAGVAELKLFGWPTPTFGTIESDRELQARAERVRLLYVAMTRAKQRLVVSGGWSEPGVEIPPLEAKNIADLVARRDSDGAFGRLVDRRAGREASEEAGVTWVMPELERSSDVIAVVRSDSVSSVSPDAVAADAVAIAVAREHAERRMSVRWSRAASDAAHRARARRETEIDEERGSLSYPRRRGAAASVGTAVHHLFETLDLEDDLAGQIEARSRAVIEEATDGLGADEVRSVTNHLEGLLDHLRTSACLAHFAELAPQVVARELDVFLKPTEDDGTSVISGAIDLVYTDPGDGRMVVADYKTDTVETEPAIAERVERYRPQLENYARALQQALGLDEEPHTELWFLHPDRIVRL